MTDGPRKNGEIGGVWGSTIGGDARVECQGVGLIADGFDGEPRLLVLMLQVVFEFRLSSHDAALSSSAAPVLDGLWRRWQ